MSNIKKEYKSCHIIKDSIESYHISPLGTYIHEQLVNLGVFSDVNTSSFECKVKFTDDLSNEIREDFISEKITTPAIDKIKELNPEMYDGITPCLSGYHEVEMFRDQIYSYMPIRAITIDVCVRDDIYSKMMGEVNLSDADILA
jgi:hypothetical protein